VRSVVFSRLGFHVKICVLVFRLIYFYLRGFVTSGIRASGSRSICCLGRFLVARLGSTALFRSTSAVLHHQAASSKLATVVFSRDPIYQIDMVLASAVHAFPLVICFPHHCRSIKLPRSPSPSSCSWFLSGTIFNPALYYVL
jgi:hypothetical protein